MAPEFDIARLGQLREQLGADPRSLAAVLERELSEAIRAIAAGLAAGDLEAVAQAAHAARNSALVIGARPLLAHLAALESSARRGDLAGARAARPGLDGRWRALQESLQDAANRDR